MSIIAGNSTDESLSRRDLAVDAGGKVRQSAASAVFLQAVEECSANSLMHHCFLCTHRCLLLMYWRYSIFARQSR